MAARSVAHRAARSISTIRTAVGVMFRADPRSTSAAIVLTLLMAALPSATLVVQRNLVERVSGGTGNTLVGGLLAAVVAYAVFVVAEDAIDLVLSTCTDNVRDRVDVHVSGKLIEHVNDFPTMELFESPALLDALELAKLGTPGFGKLCWSVFGVGARMLGLIPIVILLWQVQPWIPVVVLLGLIPMVWLTLRVPLRVWDLKAKLAGTARRRDHLQSVLTDSAYAADVRLYRSAPSWFSAWRDLSSEVIDPVVRLRTRSVAILIGVTVLSGAVMALPIGWIALNLSGPQGAGTFVLVLSSIVMLRVAVWVLMANGKDLVESARGVGHWQEFMRTTPAAVVATAPMPRADHSPTHGAAITLRDVEYRYPDAPRPVFDGLSLSLEEGTSTALVGSNGAGKTTLTKLLTGLAEPDAGTIFWGRDSLSELDADAFRRQIAVVPQNFSRLPLSIRDNLTMGQAGVSDERLLEVLEQAGLADLATDVGDLDAVLSKEVAGGTNLSGGQWQRLAIARAAIVAPHCELFIWDEPTSALDPLVEFDVVQRLLDLSRGRTSLIVSHRLGVCTLVDRVVMLDRGQVVEDGTHAELLARGGEYARWFDLQGRPYVNGSTEG